MEVIRAPCERREAPQRRYSGVVWTGKDIVGMEPSRLRAVSEQFSPGARTAWHSEPYGQVLHVLFGVGRVQRRGGPVLEVLAGDTVVCHAGEWHWHGAAPDSFVAVMSTCETDALDVGTEWGAHVSDAEYRLPPMGAVVPRQDEDRTFQPEVCW
ncbi:cupin domain-containing protein [Dactylosporangium fulvum]|uniref:Cupin domain-containing protein n=1 Tax=Dactylosporangium fulvum TaxID=53359 RepID=A0ABY5WAA6_9ACTN|nr:cupin domain-containing protein [Dactylosporangium fulvum]UWP86280.1 cupin domain-containing protein [Dactylosporangium fulvum]